MKTRSIILSFALIMVMISCERPGKVVSEVKQDTITTTPYLPEEFADSDRLEKMKAFFPVIDKIYKDYAAKNHFPGMAFGIVADGKLIYSNALGMSNLAAKIPASAQTCFRIASMSKSFTAMAILRLRDEGKLNLQDPVSKFISSFTWIKYPTQDSPPITIEHLLTMSAGFPEDNPWGDRQLADSDQDLLALIQSGISFARAPGLNFEYSNLGFATLGKVVTIVSGEPYQSYITEHILKPLQMDHSRYEFSEIPKSELALGYRWENDQWKEERMLHDGAYGAMGGLICSVEDFSKYLAFHLSAWPPRNGAESPVLNRSSLREMHQLQRFGGLVPNYHTRNGKLCPVVTGYSYGLGWREDCTGDVSVRHSGGLPGFGSEWRFFPSYGIGIVSMSNLTYGAPSPANAKALDTLIELAHLKPRVLPVSAILMLRQKEIMELLPNWSAKQLSIFAENFFLDESLESRKKATSRVLEESGGIVKPHEVIPENQLRGTFMIEGKKNNIEVFFTLTPERNRLIQQLEFSIVEKQ